MELQLSEGAANRRVQAARLVRDVPEVRAQLLEGTLSLTNAAKVQSFCNSENKPIEEKREILSQVQNLSQNECIQKLFEISPQAIPRERERIVSPVHRELSLVISEETYQKLEQLRGMLAHALPEVSLARLFEHMLDLAIAEQHKKRVGVRKQSANLDSRVSNCIAAAQTKKLSSGKQTISRDFSKPRTKRTYIPKANSAPAWIRAQNQCEHVTPDGRRCTARHRLQVDHIQPLSQGGSNDATNLRILCWAHNQALSPGRFRR